MACFVTLMTLYSTIFSASLSTINGAFIEELTEAIAIKHEEKMSHLHFYFHDILSGKHPSAVRIAGQTDSSHSTITNFGTTMMIDDALTEGLKPTSKLVGRAQGLYAIACQSEIALLMVMNLAFIEGKYNGSSISILGRNPVFNNVREMPIVGGSGLFRHARGYALAHTVWLDPNTGDATVEYNVFVWHSSLMLA